jgi:hypothetical protein
MPCEFHLIRHNGGHPPGGFPYDCPKTGRKFPSIGGIADTATAVTQYHLANPKIFSGAEMDFAYNLELVDCYTCFRLGNPRQYCTNGKLGNPPVIEYVNSNVCPKCKTVMSERLCPTCSGHKVIGWTCKQCKVEYSK